MARFLSRMTFRLTRQRILPSELLISQGEHGVRVDAMLIPQCHLCPLCLVENYLQQNNVSIRLRMERPLW